MVSFHKPLVEIPFRDGNGKMWHVIRKLQQYKKHKVGKQKSLASLLSPASVLFFFQDK